MRWQFQQGMPIDLPNNFHREDAAQQAGQRLSCQTLATICFGAGLASVFG